MNSTQSSNDQPAAVDLGLFLNVLRRNLYTGFFYSTHQYLYSRYDYYHESIRNYWFDPGSYEFNHDPPPHTFKLSEYARSRRLGGTLAWKPYDWLSVSGSASKDYFHFSLEFPFSLDPDLLSHGSILYSGKNWGEWLTDPVEEGGRGYSQIPAVLHLGKDPDIMHEWFHTENDDQLRGTALSYQFAFTVRPRKNLVFGLSWQPSYSVDLNGVSVIEMQPFLSQVWYDLFQQRLNAIAEDPDHPTNEELEQTYRDLQDWQESSGIYLEYQWNRSYDTSLRFTLPTIIQVSAEYRPYRRLLVGLRYTYAGWAAAMDHLTIQHKIQWFDDSSAYPESLDVTLPLAWNDQQSVELHTEALVSRRISLQAEYRLSTTVSSSNETPLLRIPDTDGYTLALKLNHPGGAYFELNWTRYLEETWTYGGIPNSDFLFYPGSIKRTQDIVTIRLLYCFDF